MVASAVALALALSSWLMAPLTFGSYRWLLPLEKRYQPNERAYRMGQHVYRWTIYASLLLCVPALLLIAVLSLNSWMLAGLLVSVVLYDFLSHGENPRPVVNGQLVVRSEGGSVGKEVFRKCR